MANHKYFAFTQRRLTMLIDDKIIHVVNLYPSNTVLTCRHNNMSFCLCHANGNVKRFKLFTSFNLTFIILLVFFSFNLNVSLKLYICL